jgi:hypothetical protein
MVVRVAFACCACASHLEQQLPFLQGAQGGHWQSSHFAPLRHLQSAVHFCGGASTTGRARMFDECARNVHVLGEGRRGTSVVKSP